MSHRLRDVVKSPPAHSANDFELRTYRFVRVLIVVLTLGLVASVVVEVAAADCVLGSISAYYYTPARGLFTGALIGIGVCLIAIRGENDLQDGLLNAAGLFGPIVALVPMRLKVGTAEDPSREAVCIINATRVEDLRTDGVKEVAFDLVTAGRADSIRNNTWALLIMLGLGLLLLGGLIALAHLRSTGDVAKPKWWPFALSVAGAVGVWALYVFANDFYIDKFHFIAAILMFAAVSIFAVVDGLRAILLQHAVKRGVTYVALGGMLLGGSGVIMLVGRANDWDYTTFTAEMWGIGVFVLFWVMQTIDLWNHKSRGTAILASTPD